MKIKEGASLIGLKIEMRKVLITAEYIYKKLNQELVVTSGTDGTHSAGSLHYYGYALDFRTRFFTDEEKKQVVEELRKTLQSDYHVVEHQTHIHVEYDKAKIKPRGIISGSISFDTQ